MQEFSDRQLDDCIAKALNDGHVTPHHKQRAWEELQRRAAGQTMLPPLKAEPNTPLLIVYCRALAACVKRHLHAFLFDESVYRRAREHYIWLELYDADTQSFTMQQRFAYAVFRS